VEYYASQEKEESRPKEEGWKEEDPTIIGSQN